MNTWAEKCHVYLLKTDTKFIRPKCIHVEKEKLTRYLFNLASFCIGTNWGIENVTLVSTCTYRRVLSHILPREISNWFQEINLKNTEQNYLSNENLIPWLSCTYFNLAKIFSFFSKKNSSFKKLINSFQSTSLSSSIE